LATLALGKIGGTTENYGYLWIFERKPDELEKKERARYGKEKTPASKKPDHDRKGYRPDGRLQPLEGLLRASFSYATSPHYGF
jgi:hypothetical protein